MQFRRDGAEVGPVQNSFFVVSIIDYTVQAIAPPCWTAGSFPAYRDPPTAQTSVYSG